jgi:hypothetical protein
MQRHDPVREFEISSRGMQALDREAHQPQTELHRRIIEARDQSRRNDLNALLALIDTTIAVA